jgi:hypothetical protein
MDALEGLVRLARRAREEPTPVFGVADAVRLRILSERPQAITLIPLGLFGGLSALAASVILALAVQFWNYMTSPIMELVVPLREIRLW